MQSRDLSTEVRSMSIGDMEVIVKLTFSLTGANNMEEVGEKLNSRYNNTDEVLVNAIPLGDWCKDNNYNKIKVFSLLRDEGYLTRWNELTEEGIGILHNLNIGDNISVRDLVLFNTYTTGQGTKVVMVNSSSKYLENLLSILEPLSKTSYVGSKGFDLTRICHAMNAICTSYKIID